MSDDNEVVYALRSIKEKFADELKSTGLTISDGVDCKYQINSQLAETYGSTESTLMLDVLIAMVGNEVAETMNVNTEMGVQNIDGVLMPVEISVESKNVNYVQNCVHLLFKYWGKPKYAIGIVTEEFKTGDCALAELNDCPRTNNTSGLFNAASIMSGE